MSVISQASTKGNIWELNPELQYISPFKEFLNDVGEKESNKILTAMFLIWHPKSHLRSSMREEDIIRDMNTNYLGDEDFPWENYKELRDAMENDMSRMDRLLLNAEKQLIERDKFLDKWKWTKEEAKDKNTLMASTKKLWDDYLEIKAKVDQEKKEGTSRGGYKKSLIERHHGKKTG